MQLINIAKGVFFFHAVSSKQTLQGTLGIGPKRFRTSSCTSSLHAPKYSRTVVEVDEAKFGKRKYNRGRMREGHSVIGGVERGTAKVFMEVVPSRDAATLLPIIINHVLPGTEIHTAFLCSFATTGISA